MKINTVVLVAIVASGISVFAAQNDVAKLKPTAQAANLSLQFRGAEFTDVCQVLGKAVGIEIRLAPDVKVEKPVTMKFMNADFEGVFTTLMTALNLNYTVVDQTTVLVTAKVVP
jgi:hypothetical protein